MAGTLPTVLMRHLLLIIRYNYFPKPQIKPQVNIKRLKSWLQIFQKLYSYKKLFSKTS